MLKNNERSAEAHLTAGFYFRQIGNSDEFTKKFIEQVTDASLCAPDDPEVILAQTEVAKTKAELLVKSARTAKNAASRDREIQESRKAIEEACPPLHQGIQKGVVKIQATPQPFPADPEARIRERKAWVREQNLLAKMFLELVSFEVRLNRLSDAKAVVQQGVDVLPAYPELREQLADVCIREKKWDEATKQLEALEKLDFSSANIGYYSGRILAGQEKWLQAIRTLEAAAANAAKPPLSRQIEFLLGNCYGRIGQSDRRYEAYVKALPPDPLDDLWFQVSMQTAAALVEMGRPREAISVYERVGRQYQNAFIPLARLKFQETLRQNDPRNWKPVEELLEQAPEELDREILRAELLWAQKKPDEARTTLLHARETYPEAIQPWAALAFLQFLMSRDKAAVNGINEATQTLAQAEAKFGDRVLFRLTRAKLITTGKPADVDQEVERLTHNLDKFTPDERWQLLSAFAEFAQQFATPDCANRLWDRLARERPDNLRVQRIRFDNAFQANDKARLLQAKEQIERIDQVGQDSGSSAKFVQVWYLIWEFQQTGDDQKLQEAHGLLRDLSQHQGARAEFPLTDAIVFEKQKDYVSALGKYREAIQLGVRAPEVIRRTFALCALQGHKKEAIEIRNLLPEGVENPEAFQLLEAEVSLQTHKVDRALELARNLVPVESKDYSYQILRFQTLWSAAKNAEYSGNTKMKEANYKEASVAVAHALEIAPEKPQAWVAKVQLCVSLGNKPEAEKTIEEAKVKINNENKLLALAECYRFLGKLDLAWGLCESALKDRPHDLPLLKTAASIQLLRKNIPQGKKLAEQILNNDNKSVEDKVFAERLLALISADEGDRQSKRDAIKLFEQSRDQQDLSDDDLFHLAQLYILVGDWSKARVTLISLTKGNENPLYLGFYAFHLIRHKDLAEADNLVTRLEKSQPDAIETVELRARVLAASDKEKARDLLLKQAAKPNAPLLVIARLLEELGWAPTAEKLYALYAADSKKPEAPLELAVYYGRQNRTDEALRVCEKVWKDVPPETVSNAAVQILYLARPEANQADIRKMIGRLDEELPKAPRSPTLLSNMAALLNLLGDYPGAISNYRKVIDAKPKDKYAPNNLAYLLLAHENQQDEALKVLERAENAFGRLPTLLDTEAQVYIAKNDPANAVKRLQEAIDERPKGSYYFHLAQAYLLDHKLREASDAWKTAHQTYHLDAADLHRLERAAYLKLADELKSPGTK